MVRRPLWHTVGSKGEAYLAIALVGIKVLPNGDTAYLPRWNHRFSRISTELAQAEIDVLYSVEEGEFYLHPWMNRHLDAMGAVADKGLLPMADRQLEFEERQDQLRGITRRLGALAKDIESFRGGCGRTG